MESFHKRRLRVEKSFADVQAAVMPIPTSAEIRASFLDFFREKQHTMVPSSSLLPDAPNLLFTNAGMNQFVPYFLGEQSCPFRPARAADTQKCIRAGGKHNDLEDVGLDTYHHTFFEMLGNWSFGDYFKAEAIRWAWELVVERWGFPASRLYATVYQPGEGDPGSFDEEARQLWAELFSAAGLDPDTHIVPGNRKDNFWMMGETGPCGPCSELHMDLTEMGDTAGQLVNCDDPRCIEIWNLVFIEFNADTNGGFSPLPKRHVDTGMGFERVVSIIQGTNGLQDFSQQVSNYATDVFRPLFDELEVLCGRKYSGSHVLPGTIPKPGSTEADDVAFRVIADHVRALSFSIADGILPGNTDRNYVLRRILRRAVRAGRTLGFEQPFVHKLVGTLSRTMGEVFPELKSRREVIEQTILAEEESFNRTLDRGLRLFEQEAERLGNAGESRLSGAFSFKLYDEQGFPFDLTRLLARERGLGIDEAGFETLMEQQRSQARANQKKQVIEALAVDAEETKFTGYDTGELKASVIAAPNVKGKQAVVCNQTPFYAEMGGQIGDTGILKAGNQEWAVTDTRKAGSTFLHFLAEGQGAPPSGEITLSVNWPRRLSISRHHSVTHLLHWAIHEVVSAEATQKGSYVGPDKLTFDFNSSALSREQVLTIERLVNERILENSAISAIELPYEEVRGRDDILQFFGDTYGDNVRVVQIGGAPTQLDGFSMELCGGTHVSSTGEIGLFRITSEGAVASGVRRIEAHCGLNSLDLARQIDQRLEQVAKSLNCPLTDIEKKVSAVLERNAELEKSLKAAAAREATRQAEQLEKSAATLGKLPAIIAEVSGADSSSLQLVLDQLKSRFEGVVFLIGVSSAGQVALSASVSKPLTSTIQAGKIIGTVAPLVGGKGGGKPEMARGGGKDPEGVAKAIDAVKRMVSEA